MEADMGFLRRLFDAFFPAVVPVADKERPEPAAIPVVAPLPLPAPEEERFPVHREQLLFALGVASSRASAYGLRLTNLMARAEHDPAVQAELPSLREMALKALADVEAFTSALGESGDMTADHVGLVITHVVKARLGMGVNP
jgi:hypothetical protein